jgi:hypothetical protein
MTILASNAVPSAEELDKIDYDRTLKRDVSVRLSLLYALA